MNIESYNRTLSMDGSEMPLHEVPSGSHHAGVGSLPGGNEEMGVAVPPDLRMRMRKGNKHMKKHGPGGMGHVAREKWINGAPATHPLLQQETYNRTLSTDGSELPLHEVPSGPHRFGCGSLPGGNEETGVAVLPMERMAGGVAGKFFSPLSFAVCVSWMLDGICHALFGFISFLLFFACR
ncbi:hypothetical protein BDQ17DRAFT_392027 [Cyathus striatus]|nr:hypothetical protein BDQ17DRAFT_392027 [Cyathus striatus]